MTLDGAMADRREGEKGFSLVEALLAAMLSLVVAAAVFALMQPSNGLFASGLESADMQQRLRVAEGTLARS
ncbi:MAG TPA: prepilin-type N-terminal cleavage/methylation domain-containing protein, partial [Vicinamibacterales bacterium]|nr:prepilin-type N-terminal cleavage/methylation domain-containing protein [Vicinamibacterales bacterium]